MQVTNPVSPVTAAAPGADEAAAGDAETADAPRVGVVHVFHFGHAVGRHHGIDQIGEVVDQCAHQQQAAKKQQACGKHKAPFGTHQTREAREDKPQQLAADGAAMAVELLMPAHSQMLQPIDQVAAVASALRQCQVLAQVPVRSGKRLGLLTVSLATLQGVELQGERLPVGLVLLLKQALFHVGPKRPRAMPWRCCSACSAGTCRGSARMLASS